MRRIIHRSLLAFVAALGVGVTAGQAMALTFDGIEFPQGTSSFADSVIRYAPLHNGGPGPTAVNYQNPLEALGAPNYAGDIGAVTLGRGGLVELAFTDNLLTNSGSDMKDLHIFEVGDDVEDTFIAVRPTAATRALILGIGVDVDNDGFFEIGSVGGSTSSIDLDVFFPGFAAGTLQFDAVQLIDDWNEGDISGGTVGADIDAVGAITSQAINIEQPVASASNPEPTTAAMGVLALLGLTGLATRRRA